MCLVRFVIVICPSTYVLLHNKFCTVDGFFLRVCECITCTIHKYERWLVKVDEDNLKPLYLTSSCEVQRSYQVSLVSILQLISRLHIDRNLSQNQDYADAMILFVIETECNVNVLWDKVIANHYFAYHLYCNHCNWL